VVDSASHNRSVTPAAIAGVTFNVKVARAVSPINLEYAELMEFSLARHSPQGLVRQVTLRRHSVTVSILLLVLLVVIRPVSPSSWSRANQ
jgi:hypothetical protein